MIFIWLYLQGVARDKVFRNCKQIENSLRPNVSYICAVPSNIDYYIDG